MLIGALAALTIFAISVQAPAAQAETGELLAFGEFGFGEEQFAAGGPVAVDPADGSIYVADLDASLAPRIRKFGPDGSLLASTPVTAANPSGGTLYVVGLAVDTAKDRVYALLDADDHGAGMAREVLAYSTVPQNNTLVAPSDLSSGVLVDFRLPAGGSVDDAVGLAVDPVTDKVAVLGVDDASVSDPSGVLQYVTDAGALSTRVTGLGAGPDPGATAANPAGLAIGPDGTVYIASQQLSDNSAAIYTLPAENGTPTLFARDAARPFYLPQLTPGFQAVGGVGNVGVGSPISISNDGATVYLAEGDGFGGYVRGYATASGPAHGTPRIFYGGGSSGGNCWIPNQSFAMGLAAGAGDGLVVTSFNVTGSPGQTLHVFGEGGSGCLKQQVLFTVNGSDGGGGAITVAKGETVAFSADGQLLGGAISEVDWDFDDSGAFATQATPVSLQITHKFLTPGIFHVGVQIHSDGVPPVSEPVYHDVKVVAPTPIAAFIASTHTPVAGATVSFDASNSLDPAGSSEGGPSHSLATYKWDFGDGQSAETSNPKVDHSFANPAATALSRTVKLTVVSHDDVASAPVQQTLTVAGTPASGGGGSGSPSPAPAPAPTPKPKPAPKCKKGFAKKHGKCVKRKKHRAPKKHKTAGKRRAS